MKIYNKEKTQILENVDLKLGYLKYDTLLISEEQQEQFHYQEEHYENGGVAKYRIVDEPYKPAKYEEIQVYILYTEKELNQNRILELKQSLSDTDYVANKLSEEIATSFVTGDNSNVIALRNEYFNILADRDAWREEINRLEEELKNGK